MQGELLSMEKAASPVLIPIEQITPNPLNDTIYGAIDPTSQEIQDLAKNIRAVGVLEALVLTQDYYILSGHRRYMASRIAGQTHVKCVFSSIRHGDTEELNMLATYNQQREKNNFQKIREQIALTNKESAYKTLCEHRMKASQVIVEDDSMRKICQWGSGPKRSKTSAGKAPFLNAVQRVIEEYRKYLPLTIRQIHYALLNDPPPIFVSKGKKAKNPAIYGNNVKSYRALSKLLANARVEGSVSFNSIHDPTRPLTISRTDKSVATFVRREIDWFLKSYARDLMQSQPNHIEILAEKQTVHTILSPIAAQYSVPLTIGKGYSSIHPKYEMAKRFWRSGKERLILLVLSDFDPDGECIADSFVRSMKSDFGVYTIDAWKVGINKAHALDIGTARQEISDNGSGKLKAKRGSSRYQKFVEKYGEDVYELEAVPPDKLQQMLVRGIESVIDTDAYNSEVEKEKEDAVQLEAIHTSIKEILADTVAKLEEQAGGEEEKKK